jgi:hypothetical protein
MKTKFILHGGFTPKVLQEDDKFFQEILRDTPRDVEILLVYFAKEIDRIPKNKEEDITQFEKNKGNKSLSFEVATEELFLTQVSESDIVYLHGGMTSKISNILKKFSDLKNSFEGKIIAADSAGVNALATFSYSQNADGILEGVGVIPYKTMCHYSEQFKNKVPELNKYAPDSELLLLSEYQYKVFEI